MNQQDDATRLAALLTELRNATLAMSGTTDSKELTRLEQAVKRLRDACLSLVDKYFRQTLRPVLAARFPKKGLQNAPPKEQLHSNDAAFRYTKLINDFFVQVLAKVDDPFWRQESAIALRNHASTVISNDIRDALRRRKKHEPFDDNQVRDTFDDQMAAEVEKQFRSDDMEVDVAGVVDLLSQWEASGDERQVKMAKLVRLRYIADMTMQEIAADLKLPQATAYRHHQQALTALRNSLCSQTG